jgi:uncharacterized protein (TIGR02996 family)
MPPAGKSAREISPELLSLLADAKDHPEDDGPRLVLADWVQDHGGPAGAARAEHIRLQIERARLPEEDARARALRQREEALEEEHGAAWLGLLKVRGQGLRVAFRRGLVSVTGGIRLLISKKWNALPPVEEFAWVDRLDPELPLDCAWELAASPHWHHLTALVLEGGDANTSLSLPYKRLHKEPKRALRYMQALLELPAFPRLRELWLRDNEIGAPSLGALLGSAGAAHLKFLRLGRNVVDNDGAAVLAGSPHLSGLDRLDLSDDLVGPAGACALAGSPYLANLISLDVSFNQIGPEGVAALAGSKCLPRLQTLNLDFCKLGPKGIHALAESLALPALRELTLGSCDGGSEAVAALARCPGLARLTKLELGANDIGSAGAVALARSPYLTNLKELNLCLNPLDDEAAQAIAESPTLAGLARLRCTGNCIGAAGFQALRRRFGADYCG